MAPKVQMPNRNGFMMDPRPVARANEAYQQMLSGKARFRAVLSFNT
ncbi:MAG: hypothetical protein AB7G48_01795 [Nitrospiraceae bacterium]